MTTTTREGERLGDYELLEVIESTIGRDTYLATDFATGRALEITVPTEYGVSATSAVEALVRTANRSLELNHPALASILTLDADAQGVPFVVQEHVEGETVGTLIDASLRGMPLDRVLQIMLPIAEAIAGCHELSLIHGRIDREHVIVIDGLDGPPAKLIRPGGRYATHSSRVAPELRSADHAADARSDVWGIAALMHEMLLGTAPTAHVGGVRLPPHADSLPAELAALLGVCLAVAPSARPQNAGVVRDTLQRLRTERGSNRSQMIGQPFVPRGQATHPEVAPPPEASGSAFATPAPETTLPVMDAEQTGDAPARRRRRRRAPLTDAELSVRAERSRRVRVAGTVIGHVAADSPASNPASQPQVASQSVGEPEALVAAASYALPDTTFAGQTAKELGVASVPVATESPAPQPEPAPQASPADARTRVAGQPRKAQILRTQPRAAVSRGIAARAAVSRGIASRAAASRGIAARGAASRGMDADAKGAPAVGRQRAARGVAIANGGATPRQVLRSVRAAEKAARSKSLVSDVELASQLDQLGPLDRRPRLGERPRGLLDAVARVGERDARRQLSTELFAMILCAWLLFGVPLLCDPSHEQAQQVFGARVGLGVVSVAASAVIALLQLWWIQLSTRDGALWPATTAFKALTLLVCFLAATHFVPLGTFGRLETAACAMLPWTAGAFYLFLGIYGLSRTRYNTAQHAVLGVALALLYGGSVIGSYRVITATVLTPQQASRGTGGQLEDLNSKVQKFARKKRPSAELGRDDRATEAELEALGDTSGDGDEASNARHVRDGSDQDSSKDSEQVRAARAERAAKLEAVDQQLKKLQQR